MSSRWRTYRIKSCSELEIMPDDLKLVGYNAGLITNPFLLTNHLQHPISLGGLQLKWLSETANLGQTISFNNRISKGINPLKWFWLNLAQLKVIL